MFITTTIVVVALKDSDSENSQERKVKPRNFLFIYKCNKVDKFMVHNISLVKINGGL